MLAAQQSTITPPNSDLCVAIQKLPHGLGLPLPKYETKLSAGMDLLAAISEPLIINPGQWQLIPSGVAIALPAGFEAQIRSRSGLAFKHGIAILNSPGTIDADYRGELKGILINHGQEPFTVTPGMRFAQLVIAPVSQAQWESVAELPNDTDRGVSGFGSTGLVG